LSQAQEKQGGHGPTLSASKAAREKGGGAGLGEKKGVLSWGTGPESDFKEGKEESKEVKSYT